MGGKRGKVTRKIPCLKNLSRWTSLSSVEELIRAAENRELYSLLTVYDEIEADCVRLESSIY